MTSTIFERYIILDKPVPTIFIHCDNQASIYRAQNFIYDGKSRHFVVDITLLASCFQMELSLLTLYRQRITKRIRLLKVWVESV